MPPLTGACTGKPTNWWFPLRKKETVGVELVEAKRNALAAKSICRSCPSSSECLEYSLHHEPLGIWGGLDETERAILRRARNIYADRSARVYLPGARSGRGGTRSSNPTGYSPGRPKQK
jgi:WhiB family redox-sensing transcriptional regulator